MQCVDWSDASEARQAAELMQQWAPIGVADALELLSPDFVNEEVRGQGRCPLLCCASLLHHLWPTHLRRCDSRIPHWLPSPSGIELCNVSHHPPCLQVRGHAVEVLQKTDDEELLYYLLQLVQVRICGCFAAAVLGAAGLACHLK